MATGLNSRAIESNPSPARVRAVQGRVLEWFTQHGRDFPWRKTRNPYEVLLAEVLLRQTQATRLAKPYTELLSMYPDVEALARARRGSLRHWFKPLGLVRRADMLVDAARQVSTNHDGIVPSVASQLTALPGIGTYSAAAIRCLAFNKREPMIDEGSGRLLRRILGLQADRPAYSDPSLRSVAMRLLPHRNVRDFNLALLDIAAIYCRPRNPRCDGCPLRRTCRYAETLTAPVST